MSVVYKIIFILLASVSLTGCSLNTDKLTKNANNFAEDVLDPNADTGIIPEDATENGTKWFGDGSSKNTDGSIYHWLEERIWGYEKNT